MAAATVTQPGAHSAGALTVSAASPQGGDPFSGPWGRCTIGFNVRDSSNVYYFLTSRRCGGSVGAVVYSDSARTRVLGTTVGISPADRTTRS